jgi:hypothetical protein
MSCISELERPVYHYPTFPAALCPWGWLILLTEMSTMECFWVVERGGRVMLTTSPPVSRLSR